MFWNIFVGTQVPDGIPPMLTCPPNQQVTAQQGQGGATVNYPPATATDNSGGFVRLSYNPPSGSFFSTVGPRVVVVTGTDPSGNIGQCTFTVTVTSKDAKNTTVYYLFQRTTFAFKNFVKWCNSLILLIVFP